ncbi:PREDICTED: coenzyme Q-binding protein COQ10 homolog B, mitochondrial isoform X2 [Wasmannia auropunctata]|uniref:coenzyme Q-binding protein COQ10 homolog B, mitochondrial isoform X2 n=1 Tax=Wasmannia auropunctata TaxID=64793 RepID=UPI0005ED49DC|nr:PREDICTED: coenzyme Q-binding protein COQ10 homolog B, mitochondrial isoform X2 [Wasmannia auropunctata]
MHRHALVVTQLSLPWKYDSSKRNLWRMYRTRASYKTREYEGRMLVGFSMEKMYHVVADVENYKNFLPFCKKSEITLKTKDLLKANLVIGFPPINESYTSTVTTIYPRIVKAECKDGRLFDHLDTLWLFNPGLKNNPETCVIDFSLSFEFKSVIYSHLLNLFFNDVVRQMENAFLEEAKNRYGQPCLRTVRLQR